MRKTNQIQEMQLVVKKLAPENQLYLLNLAKMALVAERGARAVSQINEHQSAIPEGTDTPPILVC